MIQLIQSGEGHLVIANNAPFQSKVQHVEYFRDLRLLMLAYDDESSDLMPCEINEQTDKFIRNSAEAVIVELKDKNSAQKGYLTTLVQIGL